MSGGSFAYCTSHDECVYDSANDVHHHAPDAGVRKAQNPVRVPVPRATRVHRAATSVLTVAVLFDHVRGLG